MNEETLKQGIEIKRRLDTAREVRANIKEKQNLCSGNYSEVTERKFVLDITDRNQIKCISISSSTAYEALKTEWEKSNIKVETLEKELDQLK
jgi:hypothetical protein